MWKFIEPIHYGGKIRFLGWRPTNFGENFNNILGAIGRGYYEKGGTKNE